MQKQGNSTIYVNKDIGFLTLKRTVGHQSDGNDLKRISFFISSGLGSACRKDQSENLKLNTFSKGKEKVVF